MNIPELRGKIDQIDDSILSLLVKRMEFVEEIARSFCPVIIDLTSGLRRAKDGTHGFYKKLGYNNEGSMAKLYLRKEIL